MAAHLIQHCTCNAEPSSYETRETQVMTLPKRVQRFVEGCYNGMVGLANAFLPHICSCLG